MTQGWAFEGRQGGIVVFSGETPDMQAAIREAMHYTAQYSQDGPMDLVKVWPITDGEEQKR